MPKFFIAYGVLILILFTTAAYQGYAINSLFAGAQHTGPNQSRYHK